MNKLWVKAALIRAIKTMAQSAVAIIGTQSVGILDADWISILSVSVMAGILSILTSIAGLPEVETTKLLEEPILDINEEDWETKGDE